MTRLHESAKNIFLQLIQLINQLDSSDYKKSLAVLSDGSIGKHTRHILEFYDCLQKGLETKVIDYDKRERNIQIEENCQYAINYIDGCIEFLNSLPSENIPLKLCFTTSEKEEEEPMLIGTTLYRELAYNIEHAIHHLAILKIAVLHHLPHIILPENFGLAYSTIQYQQK